MLMMSLRAENRLAAWRPGILPTSLHLFGPGQPPSPAQTGRLCPPLPSPQPRQPPGGRRACRPRLSVSR